MKGKGLLLLILNFTCICSARADYQKPVVSRIPVYRLVVNLENLKNQDPKDPHNYYALGRLYSMCFAQKQDSMEAVLRQGEEDYSPYYGIDPNQPEFSAVKQTKDSTKVRFARECLDRAIENFKTSLHLDSTYIPSLLGLAWCIDQKGNKDEAIARYHDILARTTRQEKGDISSLETAETAGYLIKLLDKEKDNDEIAILQAKIKSFKPNYMISPVLIPLTDEYTFEDLTDTLSTVHFDLDGTGMAKDWQWISEKAGWLVYRKEAEKIENAMQLFGNRSFNIFWENGYNAMGSLDDNHDGLLSGSELRSLAVWQDKNKNGISEEGELASLETLGIEALQFSYVTVNNTLLKSEKGILFKNGSSRTSYDWFPRCKSRPM